MDVELRLQATSKIQGTVFQPDGVTPVGPNVQVHYKSSAFKQVCATSGNLIVGDITIEAGTCRDIPQGIQDETVITDTAGHYVLPLVNAGPFTLTAEDTFTGKTAQIVGAIKPGQTGDFSIRLLGLSTLTIRVKGSDSTTPIPGAVVSVSQIAYPHKKVPGKADDTGTLVLSGGDAFSEGDLVVIATDVRNGFAGRASGRVIKDGDNVTIDVFLFNASGTVFGTVFQADGVTAVPNAEVVISNCVGDPFYIGTGSGAVHHRRTAGVRRDRCRRRIPAGPDPARRLPRRRLRSGDRAARLRRGTHRSRSSAGAVGRHRGGARPGDRDGVRRRLAGAAQELGSAPRPELARRAPAAAAADDDRRGRHVLVPWRHRRRLPAERLEAVVPARRSRSATPTSPAPSRPKASTSTCRSSCNSSSSITAASKASSSTPTERRRPTWRSICVRPRPACRTCRAAVISAW